MVNNIPGKVGPPDDLAAIVNALRLAVGSSEASEIGHGAVVPEKRMNGGYARSSIGRKAGVRRAHDHTRPLIVASGARSSIGSTQGADILNLAPLPNERSHLCGR